MELLQLKYFLTVAKWEHMTRAAEKLHIAQPALSRSIHRLEEDLGVPLFDRHGRTIRLNHLGKAFQEKVQEALRLLDEGRREVEDRAGLAKGHIHVAVMNIEAVREPLQRFLTEYPEVDFQIVQTSLDYLDEEFDQEIDFILTSLPMQEEGLEEHPLVSEHVYLLVPHDHPLAQRQTIDLNEVSTESFVGYKSATPLRRLNDELCHQAGFVPHMVCETEDPQSIVELVRCGFGVAIVGGCKSAEELGLAKIPIRQPTKERLFRIIWRKDHYLSKAARQFRQFMIQYFEDQQADHDGLKTSLTLR